MTDNDRSAKPARRLKVSELDNSRPHDVDLSLTREEADALARDLGIDGARKLRLSGRLSPVGKADWRFTGEIGATVTQPCVVTLEPVTTRIDAPVERLWLRDMPEITAEESEAPEDVSTDPLGSHIDLAALLGEALALNLPDYPRADGAHLEETNFTAPGETAMTDDDARPFAGLAGLRDKLAAKDDPGGTGGGTGQEQDED